MLNNKWQNQSVPQSCIHIVISPRDTASISAEFSLHLLHCTLPNTNTFPYHAANKLPKEVTGDYQTVAGVDKKETNSKSCPTYLKLNITHGIHCIYSRAKY